MGAFGVVSVLSLVGIGVATGIALAPEPLPTSLIPGPEITSVPVTYETFDDSRQTPFVLSIGEVEPLAVPRPGTVTNTACVSGATVSSGDVPLTIDSQPVAALYTGYPFWRDLRVDQEGPDVAALQEELIRLGYSPNSTGKFDKQTSRAVDSFLKDRGFLERTGDLPLSAILQLQSTEIVISDCVAALADLVEQGDPFASTGGGIALLRPAATAEGQVDGERIVSFAGAQAAIQDDGTVTDRSFLDGVGASAEYSFEKNQVEDNAEFQMVFETSLAKPLRTAVVPASALFAVDGSAACLSVDGVRENVTIISSMLGSTYVQFADGTEPDHVDILSQPDRTSQGSTCS